MFFKRMRKLTAEDERGIQFTLGVIMADKTIFLSRRVTLAALGIAALLVACTSTMQSGDSGVGHSDIGGVVTGPKGPEAGVWVIAETTDLPTRFAKVVVTDDQGRYLIPELPKARYNV